MMSSEALIMDMQANDASRARLRAVLDGLSDEELALPAGDGWTIAAYLAHLAFWDYRVLVLLKRWEKTGIGSSPIDTDAVNDALLPLFLSLLPTAAAAQAVEAAEEVDAVLENLPEGLEHGIDELVRQGIFRRNRSIHRNQHLDEIEQVVARARGA
jgi:DinB superfamily